MTEVLAEILGGDILAGLTAAMLYLNAGIALGVLAVVAVRTPLRRLVGAQTAYTLWLAPLAMGALALVFFLVLPPERRLSAPAPGPLVLAAWGVGAAVMATAFGLAQARFTLELRRGLTGPAVVGLISPRIVMPVDDGRYTSEERDLIRAHERQHIARKDTRAIALLALARCIFWFNPFVHLAAGVLRLDQELACDAAVVMNRPAARGLYARALLKTQLAATPLPLGCYWPARGVHPLEVRVAHLKPRATRRGAEVEARSGRTLTGPVDAIRP